MDALQIKTDPDPMEPYRLSQAFRVGDLVITSGQAAITASGELVGVGDFDAQAEQVFANLADVLEAAGSSGTIGSLAPAEKAICGCCALSKVTCWPSMSSLLPGLMPIRLARGSG